MNLAPNPKQIAALISMAFVLLAIPVLPDTAEDKEVLDAFPTSKRDERREYELRFLEPEEMPYTWEEVIPFYIHFPVDDDGVIVFPYRGEDHYHPTQINQKALQYINAYVKTGRAGYLNRSEIFASRLLDLALDEDGALFLPYAFDRTLLGIPDEELKAPWYSGMSQGQALSVFVRLYEITGKPEYLSTAKSLFRSLAVLKGSVRDGDPWVSCIDDQGYYWIEEYPMEEPIHVLNGMIFAMYGLYDYWILTNDTECHGLLQASLRTVADHLLEYRNNGSYSSYDLGYRVVLDKYHATHMKQMRMLNRITGDPYFLEVRQLFWGDEHVV